MAPVLSFSKAPSLGGVRGLQTRSRRGSSARATAANSPTAQDGQQIWFPGTEPPSHLPKDWPAYAGFDPARLGENRAQLEWNFQAELQHCRWAMLGAAGILTTDLMNRLGVASLPEWFEAGASNRWDADPLTLFVVQARWQFPVAIVDCPLQLKGDSECGACSSPAQMYMMGFVEMKRFYDFKSPGSQGKAGSFIGFEKWFQGTGTPGYPGNIFDPLKLAKDGQTFETRKTQELKNGRLAMVAMAGFFVQAYTTGESPLTNLAEHIRDPWNANAFHSAYLQLTGKQ